MRFIVFFLDRLNEDQYCHAIHAYSALNDRTSLLRLYSDVKLVLQNELNASPLHEPETLYQELLNKV